MIRTRAFISGLGSILWTGAFAVLFTALVSAAWSGLLLFNLKISPAFPWSVAAMASLLIAAMTFLNGGWGPKRSQEARRALLRARSIRPSVFTCAVIAGALSIAALAGLWMVLFQLVKVQGNVSDFSHLPPLTVASALAMAALSGALSEEAGFRGYFQGTLERYLPGWFAILVAALAMIPEHGATQGFAWPTILFYLLVDSMLGLTAYLTQSVLPGIVIHTIGLVTFFGFIWPYDRSRPSVWIAGADEWFWVHVAQTLVFGLLALLAYRWLARMTNAQGHPNRKEFRVASVDAAVSSQHA